MVAVLSASEETGQTQEAKEYKVDDQVYGRVSASSMGIIEAARTLCGADSSWQRLLEEATRLAQGRYEVVIDLYTYGRFELNLQPRELGEFFRTWVPDTYISAREVRGICTNAVRYHKKINAI